jgi:predicted Zn-dependent protease
MTTPTLPRRTTALLVLAALLFTGPLGCASPRSVQPIGAEGAAFALERDEQRLWEQARDEEKKLRQKAVLYEDPILEEYLNRVARDLVPPEARGQEPLRVRVTVIRDPTLNAFTYPTGSVYVHTGLLARLENEAQLATVLGHEIVHCTHRHALKHTRSVRNKAIGFSIAALAASIVVAGAAGDQAAKGDWRDAYIINQVGNILVGLGLQLAFLAAVNGFGRDLEREADEVGLARMTAAGYDPRQAPRVFEILKEDKGDPSKAEVFFFGSHPRLDERIATTRELVATRHPGAGAEGRVADTRDFRMRTRVLVRDNAALDIEAGRLNLAEDALGRVLALTPNDAVAHYLRGQVHEKRAAEAKTPAEKRDLEGRAVASYDEALRHDPAYADPHKGKGLLHFKAGRRQEALAAFHRYLELRPDAPDARQIKDYILELEAP